MRSSRGLGPFASFTDLMAGLLLMFFVALTIPPPDPAKSALKQAESAAARAEAVARAGVEGLELFAPRTLTSDQEVPQACQGAMEPSYAVVGPGYLRLEFSKALFGTKEEEPLSAAEGCLQRFGMWIAENLMSEGGSARTDNPAAGSPCFEVQVHAHADARPINETWCYAGGKKCRYRDNMELSVLRAIRVEAILRAQAMLARDRVEGLERSWNRSVSVMGHGARRPIPGIDPRADQNRRVWIDLIWRWSEGSCSVPPPLFGDGSFEVRDERSAGDGASGDADGRSDQDASTEE